MRMVFPQVLAATARAAFGAALEATLRGAALRRAPGAPFDPPAGAASRPAARRAVAPRRAATGTLVIATGAEGAVSLGAARAVIAALPRAEGPIPLGRGGG